jgi:hypothetical protein
VPDRIARAALPGLVLGVGAVAVLLAFDRAPDWTARGAALALPRQAGPGGAPILAIDREQDPARLVLFVQGISARDAYAPGVVASADRLLDASAPALDRGRLKAIIDRLMGRVGRPRRTPEFTALADEVAQELRMAENLWAQSVARNHELVFDAMLKVTSKVLDLANNWRGELESNVAVMNYNRLARLVLQTAGRAARYETSIELLQASQLLGPPSTEIAATIGIQKVLAGQVEDGRAELAAALEKLPPKGPVTAIARGVLGLALWQKKDAPAALKEIQAAWNIIGAGGVKGVTYTFTVDQSDYYIVAEMLLARYEAAKLVDPALAAQAARDLTELLDHPLNFGVRRVPAVALMGRLEWLLGHRDRALELLREARIIPSKTLEDRSDGPIGRIAHPRYRRMALETLLEGLGDDPAAAAERAEIVAELATLTK